MAAWLPGSSETQRCRLVLLRHGQTPYSSQGKYAGRADIPLTDRHVELADGYATPT